MKTNINFWSYLAQFLLRRNASTKTAAKKKTHILRSVTFYLQNRTFYDNVKKYRKARQVTVDNTAHVQCVLQNKGYRHTQYLIPTAFQFSTATMVKRTSLNVAFIGAPRVLFRTALRDQLLQPVLVSQITVEKRFMITSPKSSTPPSQRPVHLSVSKWTSSSIAIPTHTQTSMTCMPSFTTRNSN